LVAKSCSRRSLLRTTALVGSLYVAIWSGTAFAQGQSFSFDIPQQSLAASLRDYARVSGQQIIFTDDLVAGKTASPLHGSYSADDALAHLLSGTGLVVERSLTGAVMIRAERHADAAPRPAPEISGGVTRLAEIEAVVVSASRITASGFDAPTPTTVMSAADIHRSAQPNVFDTIAQLPYLQGSPGTQANANNFSTGANGLSSFNLRGLGTIRTLVLIDGQRVVPAYVTGIADVSEFPQLLLQRVDLVTGGASASWGSDAVGGVINFVTDKKFTGIKGNIEGGISTYGDYTNALFQLAAGSDIFGGAGHVEASAEFYRNDGVPAPNVPGGALANGRCCNLYPGTLAYTATTTPAGVPEFTPVLGAQNSAASEYGLITSGPLKGTAFDVNGNPVAFQYGSPCVATTCVGGDLTDTAQRTTVDDPLTRTVLYTRLSYDIAKNIEIYGTLNYGNVFTGESPPQGNKTGLAIACGNAPGGANFYLPAAINTACVANNITSFTLGVSYDKLPQTEMHTLRRQRRYVLGTDGTISLFGKDWGFDAYFQHGENDTSIHIKSILIPARYNAAVDAVAGPNGTVVCRSSVAQASGCAPFDIFGGAPISVAALSYVDPPMNGPYSVTSERQEAASLSLNGTPFRDWAGDVALAFGAEYREEAYGTIGDPYGDGVSTANPNNAAYPADPLLGMANGNNWYAGNFHHGSGNYHVSEVFAEAGVPLVNTPQWGSASLNLEGRATAYSTSGFVDTWKLGMTWETPVDGVRLRVLQSRDVRAPNLSELFAAPITTNAGVINRLLPASAPVVNILNEAIGNPDLKPETAQTTELGLVFQPDTMPGFNISIDYYRVGLKKQIGSLTSQQVVDLCQLYGNSAYCGIFNLNGAPGTTNPNYVIVQPFNLAQTVTDGFDVEVNYQFDLHDWDIPGRFLLRGLADHVSKFISNTGVIGQPVAELAGAQVTATPTTGFGGGVPLWKILLMQEWSGDPFTLDVTERFFSNGVINPLAIVCQAPNCPAPTGQVPTFSAQNVPGYLFVDVGGSFRFSEKLQAYFKIDNIGDSLPKPFALLNSDPVGRVYRIGLRFNN
jgi:outer membrane receptor protein involved in Fe transport